MYFLSRILFLVPLLVVISFIAFVLIRVAPGGPFDRDRAAATPEIEQHLKAKYHLDEPIWRQYARFLGNMARGDFGPSLKYRNHTVNDIIAQALPVSLALGSLAFVFAIGVGLVAGTVSAVAKGRWPEQASNGLAVLAVCVPGFVIGPVLILLFAVHWKIFPVGLWETPMHAVLPMITLGVYFAGKTARLMREGMLNVLNSEFITTARAKGLSETAVLFKHAFPLGVLPVLSYSGPMLADLLTGSFVVENIFQIPGLGLFMVNSSLNRDYPMVVGLVLLYAALLLALNFFVDVAYAWLDPRVRYEA